MPKIKNDSQPKRITKTPVILIIGFILGLITMSLLSRVITAIMPQPPDSYYVSEVIVVPFNQLEPTYTQFEYQGTVSLIIHGTGQAAGSDFSDAFYQFTQNGQPLAQPLLGQFDLEIDGQRAIDALNLRLMPPVFNPQHRYPVSYMVGYVKNRIAFRISDSIVDDNSGSFIIEVLGVFDY